MTEPAPTTERVEAWLVAKLAERLKLDPGEIDRREPFASYGLGSTEAVSLAGELAEWLGRALSPALAYEYPTIETLARHLAGVADTATPTPGAGPDQTADNQPIAIIGLGCRFPGAENPAALWQVLRDGVDVIREVPAERFDVAAFYDPDPSVPGKMNTRWGGFLEQVDRFDADFFGISPREAARMDPQQRLLLEVAWEALADGGQVPGQLAGSRTGVFIGIATNDYGRMQWQALEQIDAYAGTGNALSIAANRLSYLFDFRGPSLAIDTACSSSLVAVHLACASLRRGETTLALAGGVNLILSPAIAINFTKAGAMAPDGRCKAFDARADGYVRSEGAGVVLLKPLAAAVADGDPIYAVIRGSAVNQDGRSNGLMAPNPGAQEAVLREAYRQAGVSPGEVDYVEAHGSGTLLGDPIEAQALGAVLAEGRPPERPCALGAVKTNLGHLEAAAGIAGLIKVALALHHRELPPSLHFQSPNPLIPFDALPLRVQTALTPWPRQDRPALAGVSAFGFGGTNAHVVLEAAPAAVAAAVQAEPAGTSVLPLSARTPTALRSLARAYQALLATPDAAAALPDLCYSASVRRAHHQHRLAVTGASAAELSLGLETFLEAPTGPTPPASHRGKLVFVFPGQGGQWFGMARRLLAREPVFRAVIERCDRLMRPYGDWSLLAELSATDEDGSRLTQVEVLQPALFALQIALAALWRWWGIEPQTVVGHSLGEVAAAVVAGILSEEDAVRVICQRSRLVRRAVGQGAMAMVDLSLAQARARLVGCAERVSIAASNGPSATVLSGEPAALELILAQLQREEIFCRRIKVDFAAHSPQMAPLCAELVQALQGLEPRAGVLPFYSTVTGEISDGQALDAAYWGRNLREPVLFAAAVARLIEAGCDRFLELSPHPILASSLHQGLQQLGRDGVVLASLRHDQDEYAVLLGSLGALYSLGAPVAWSRLYPAAGRCRPLPAYPWQRERFWLDLAPTAGAPGTARGPADHGLLGRYFHSPHPATSHFWQTTLDLASWPQLADHRIQGVAVLPASAYLELALAAAGEVLGASVTALQQVQFRQALFLPEGARRTLQVVVSEGGGQQAASFAIYSRPEASAPAGRGWQLHATGQLSQGSLGAEAEPETLPLPAVAESAITGADYYRGLLERGIHYGPGLQSIVRLWPHQGALPGELWSELQGPPAARLDAAFQLLGAAIALGEGADDRQGLYLPSHLAQLRVYRGAGGDGWGHTGVPQRRGEAVSGDVRLFDPAGRVTLELQGLRFDHLGDDPQRAAALDPLDQWLYQVQWLPRERPASPSPVAPSPTPADAGPAWLIFADQGGEAGGVGAALAAWLARRGERAVVVVPGATYQQTDASHYRLDPESAADLQRLLAAVLAPDQPGCRGIIQLWSLALAAPAETSAALSAAQRLGCGQVLLLVQELARSSASGLPRLWLVTRGAQAAGADPRVPLALAQAPLWGLGRVMAREHPPLWGGLIDLDPGEPSAEVAAEALGGELLAPAGEDQLAFRHGQRLVARLARLPRPSALTPPVPWRRDGSYLISGGLGDLGLRVARWLVEQGARRLILLGRTPLPPRADWSTVEAGSRLGRQVAAIRELEALGASIHLAALDLADEAALGGFLAHYRAEGWPPIRGVVHAAGALQDGLLVQLDAAALTTVLRPKVLGGWLLHQLLAGQELDFFVLFSSAGAVLGQPGQGNYAAANAFLDALAHHRQALGLPALSIDWGSWAGAGFAETSGGRLLAARLALAGISPIAPEQGLELLGQLLGQPATQMTAQVMVVPVDWARYQAADPAGAAAPLLAELGADAAAASPGPAVPPSQWRQAVLDAAPAQRRPLLQSYLSQQAARVLGLSPSRLDLGQSLSDLGLDSLMAVELKNRIAQDLKVNLPIARFLQGFSVDQALTQVLEQLAAEEGASPPGNPPAAALPRADGGPGEAERLLAGLDQLSDDEVGSLLVQLVSEPEGPARQSLNG